ncbi:LysM peptidoglycan-binding domain-containing protein [Paenibacillus mesotrionivorans]|uniref:LysM peptidoglycan-binding domain-containing protein n=1 Tax=Paenibacillus mesotrionivorans TaxID=3160968 RepID=A0ACC7NXH7_9BACL
MKMSPNRLMRRLIMMAGIIVSVLSVAILHAYAGNEAEGEPALSQGYRSSTAASLTVHTVAFKQPSKTVYTVDVCPGDTLWGIAASHLPEGESVRSYINKIKKTNNLKNSDIRAGQILVLP